MEISLRQSELIEIQGAQLELLPQKAIFWEAQSTLLLADLHLGKSAHFRKNGIAIPKSSSNQNWILLHQLFRMENLKRVIFLGDLFHSAFNQECQVFSELLEVYPQLQFELVRGNHDILDQSIYDQMNLKVHQDQLQIGPFLLSHEPIEEDGNYNLAGHIHPGVRLRGKGKQSHKAACFYFGAKAGLLPAFGSLTGLHTLEVKQNDRVYIIVDGQVIPAQ